MSEEEDERERKRQDVRQMFGLLLITSALMWCLLVGGFAWLCGGFWSAIGVSMDGVGDTLFIAAVLGVFGLVLILSTFPKRKD